MTEYPGTTDDPRTRHHAMIRLNDLSQKRSGSGHKSLTPMSDDEALNAVADAPLDEIPLSAKVGVLHSLAKADYPNAVDKRAGHRRMVESVAAARGLDPKALLADIEQSARDETPFSTTSSGQALPHHEAAFIGEDVCTTRRVDVGGLPATWVFSEFVTDAAFEHVVDWVDPRSWPQRGPMMFKSMDLVGSTDPVPIQTLGDEHWHGVFHEEVQLVERLNTLLHCDYRRDADRSAAMTYKLNLSLDNQINVDRGFLLVVDEGAVRRVRALKIVGFTDKVWDDVALMVCPFWTDWVRAAVEGGTSSSPSTSSSGLGSAAGASGAASLVQDWVQFLTDTAGGYTDLVTDVLARSTSGSYTGNDWLADGREYFSRLAKDWAKAWSYGLETLDEVANQGLDAGMSPPGTPRAQARGVASALTNAPTESTTIPWPHLAEGASITVSDLTSIEAGGAVIPAAEITVSVSEAGTSASSITVRTGNTTVPASLYVGDLVVDGQPSVPVNLYVSRSAQVSP